MKLFLLAALLLSACREKAPQKPLFYYDLGPDSVDVRSYPREIQEGYEIFREKCSACHTVARPLNAPYVDAVVWDGYLKQMVYRGGFSGKMPLSTAQYNSIKAFLEYDTQIRKIKGREQFLQDQAELKRRFLELSR